MARRNRAAAANAGAAAGSAITDDPGASGALALDPPSGPLPITGPHDGEALDPEVTSAAGVVDFGAIQVPVPMTGAVTVEPTANGRMQAVHIALAGGRLSVSALAAPKSSKLWPDLAREIDKSLRDGGARVRSYAGEWGRELHATSGKAKSVFVGVDGPRWMLYGVATGPEAQADALEAELRRMLRGTVVVRGKNPYPVRTVLPLVVPEHLVEQAAEKKAAEKPAAQQAVSQQAAGQQTQVQQTQVQQTQSQQTQSQQVVAQQTGQQVAAQPAAGVPGTQRITLPPRPAPQRTGAHPPVAPAAAAEEELPPTTPLRELAPSARRAAAAAWRNRPSIAAAPEPDGAAGAPPSWADPVRRIQQGDLDDPTEVWDELPPDPAATAAPPEHAPAGPAATGGRRRLPDRPAEPAVEASGRRHLAEPPAPAPRPTPRSTGAHPAHPAAGPGNNGRPHRPEPGPHPAPRSTGAYPAQPAAEAGGQGAGTNGWGHRADPAPRSTGAYPAQPAAEAGGLPPVAGQGTNGWRRAESAPQPTPRSTGAYPVRPAAETNGRPPVAEPPVPPPPRPTPRSTSAYPVQPAGAETGLLPTTERWAATNGRRHPPEPAAQPTGGYPVGPAAGPPAAPAVQSTGSYLAEPGPESTGRRRLIDPAAAQATGWLAAEAGPGATGRRRRVEPTGAYPSEQPAEPGAESSSRSWRTGSNPVEPGVAGTGRRQLAEPDGQPTRSRPLEPAAAETSGWQPGEEATGRRRAQEAAAERSPLAEPASAVGERHPLAPPLEATGSRSAVKPAAGFGGEQTGRARLRDPAFQSTGWFPVASTDAPAEPGGRRRRREPDAADTGAWQPQSAADPVGEATGRRRLTDADSTDTGRRRLREPEDTGTGSWRPDALAEPVVESTGRRHRAEPSAEPSPPSSGAPSVTSSPEPHSDRRRAAEPAPQGTRRTLGAEYLIDTGEQAVWTGGARRYAPQPEPPTEPFTPEPSPAAPLANGPSANGLSANGLSANGLSAEARRRGRHYAPEDGESATATVRLRALIGDLDPERPSGRHRRPAR